MGNGKFLESRKLKKTQSNLSNEVRSEKSEKHLQNKKGHERLHVTPALDAYHFLGKYIKCSTLHTVDNAFLTSNNIGMNASCLI